MINVLGLCRLVRNQFPIPAAPSEIRDFLSKHSEQELPDDVRRDVVKVLIAQWKRDSWAWDDAGAVKLDPEEEALFHQNGVSLIKSAGETHPDKISVLPIKIGKEHPRVVWFK